MGTVESLDRSAGARLSARLDFAALDDRVRRDTGRTSFVIALLGLAVVAAAVYALGWRLNSVVPARGSAEWIKEGVRGPIEVGDPGAYGLALDLGDRPEADGDLQNNALVENNLALVAQADDLLKLAEQLNVNEVAPAGQRRGIRGGPIGRHDIGAGPDGPAVTPSERWVIEWGADTESGYRRKLDHFGIFLGAVRSGELVGAVRGFASLQPQTSKDAPSRWFIHRDRARVELDRKLLKEAGVAVLPTDIVAQFFPKELDAKLASLEERHSHKNASAIKRTVFGVRAAGAGYEFFVVEQHLK